MEGSAEEIHGQGLDQTPRRETTQRDLLGDSDDETEGYNSYELQCEWVKTQKVNITELKYFQSLAQNVKPFAGEPLESLSKFHEKFNQLFLAAIDIPDFWLIGIVRSKLESSAEDWAVSYFEKHGVQHVTLQINVLGTIGASVSAYKLQEPFLW